MIPKKPARLAVQLAVLTVGRLFLSTGLRMVYPFLPAFARGLGVSLTALAPLIAVRGFVGLLSPLFSPLSERYGRRPVLIASLLLFSLGCGIVLIWPTYWPLGLTLSIVAVAKVIYDPAMQAYLGDRVAYEQRGKAIAVTELSWAGSFFLGVPVLAFVIQRQGWTAPFIWLGLLGVAAASLLWRLLPAPSQDGRASHVTDLPTTLRVIRREPVIWAAAIYILLVMGANELLLIVYGGWMEGSFGLNLASLGLATSVIGAAEITGELSTGLAVDRFGKRPVIITTGLLAALMYLVVPHTSISLGMALATLFFLFLFFEMTVVGGVPLMTELAPDARGVVLSVVLAFGGLGRALGALLGPIILAHGDFLSIGLISAGVMLLAILILYLWVREGQASRSAAETV